MSFLSQWILGSLVKIQLFLLLLPHLSKALSPELTHLFSYNFLGLLFLHSTHIKLDWNWTVRQNILV